MRIKAVPGIRFASMLALATAISVAFLGADVAIYRDAVPGYLLWNLFLAWIPFGLVLLLIHILRTKSWSSWEGIGVSLVWLAFLPNTFYMVSDFLHLAEPTQPEQLLFNTVVFTSFIYTGIVLGFGSLFLVHTELNKRLPARVTRMLIGTILFICSLAIYVGRDLRWNTWDILVDPAGVLFDISTRLLHPAQYGQMFTVVIPFFVLLATMYTVAWRSSHLLRMPRHEAS
jgi:uncharacterized membrane protein